MMTGSPEILSEEIKSQLIEDVLKSPRDLGYDFSHWTLKAIVGHLEEVYDVKMSISGLARFLKRNNITRIVPRPMPAKGDEKKRISSRKN